MPPGAAALVLAAGRGERLGLGPKAFVRMEGRSLLARAISTLEEAGFARIAAVLPPPPDPEPPPPSILLARNPSPESGPLASARLGLAALEAAGEPVRLLLLAQVDHPDTRPETCEALLSAAPGAPTGAARLVPVWNARRGHPIVVLPAGLEALRRPAPPAGATLRTLLSAAGEVLEVPAPGPEVLRNLNHPEDLRETPA